MRSGGVYFDRERRKWMYQPDPFDADDCRNVAGMLGRDGWADDLLEAAHVIERHKADDVEREYVGVSIVVSEKGSQTPTNS